MLFVLVQPGAKCTRTDVKSADRKVVGVKDLQLVLKKAVNKTETLDGIQPLFLGGCFYMVAVEVAVCSLLGPQWLFGGY